MSNFRGQVQGFAVGAAAVALVMVGMPSLFPAPTATADMDELANQFGVTIVWSTAPCAPMDAEANGCFLINTPNTVYVSPNLQTDYTRYAVLHEIGHVMQYKVDGTISECAA